MELSFKSNATKLFEMMSATTIRDSIMYLLRPAEAVAFVIGTGIRFSKEEMSIYTNVFKYFIPDRKWLAKMMSQGYTLTIMGSNLVDIMDSLTPVRATANYSVHALLVVTKDENMVTIDDSFVHPYSFQYAFESPSYPSSTRMLTTTPDCWVVLTYNYGVIVGIMNPQWSKETHTTAHMPYYMSWTRYFSEITSLTTTDDESRHEIMYSHANLGKTTIKKAIVSLIQERVTDEAGDRNLFSIIDGDNIVRVLRD